jgi:NAD+ diphosphatase
MTNSPFEPFFSGPGLDRADALRADEAAIRALSVTELARELQWENGLPKLAADGRLAWTAAVTPDLFLGLDGERPCFSPIIQVTADARSAFPQMALLDRRDAPLFAAALSLSRWHSRHRFCANCGQLTLVVRGGWSRRCPNCAAEHYPRVDPVVIMLAEHDGKLLLGRQPQYPPGRYSALAGFVEVGEDVEAAVGRELFEEAGVRVRNVRYIASQPWPFPSSLMLGCYAEADGPELTIDTAELEDARWFSREQVATAIEGRPGSLFEPPPRTAIARTLIEHWLAA